METKETQCHPKPAVNATCLLGNKGCYENGKCHYMGNCEHKVLTNADRIRAMSDEELARFMADRNVNESTLLLLNKDHGMTSIQIEALRHNIYCACKQWLKQPADMRGEEDG